MTAVAGRCNADDCRCASFFMPRFHVGGGGGGCRVVLARISVGTFWTYPREHRVVLLSFRRRLVVGVVVVRGRHADVVIAVVFNTTAHHTSPMAHTVNQGNMQVGTLILHVGLVLRSWFLSVTSDEKRDDDVLSVLYNIQV